MSKPISFGFGKPKTSSDISSKPSTSISLPTKRPISGPKPTGLKSKATLQADDDDEHDDDEHDDDDPKFESVTGFSSSGAILSNPLQEKKVLVIENQGNGDWRRRGRGGNHNGATEAAATQDVVMVEKNEVSTASGLQFAPVRSLEESPPITQLQGSTATNAEHERQLKSADEEALQALLNDDPNAPRGNAVISIAENKQLRPANELEDFRSDVASRPEASTLDEYAAMPVEEFGLAMLRGMGKKRRANGEVVNVELQPENKKEIKKPKHEGFLGIGAKPVPGLEGVELGAWGKADMRKNNRGQGFFTPVMIKDRETGETITEEEFERRKKTKEGKDGSREDRGDRKRSQPSERDGARKNGDPPYKDAMNGFSRRLRDEDSGHESSRSRRDRETDHDADPPHSKAHRSRSRERRSGRDDRYESKSSRRDRDYDRDRDRDRDRHRDRDRDSDRHKYWDRDRERDREREREYDRDDRRHRDRR